MTLGQVLARALGKAHLPLSKRGELDYVVAEACGWDRPGLLVRLNQPCDGDLAMISEEIAGKLASGYPAEYITGRATFCDLELRVGEGVLVPRSETEALVQLAGDVITTEHIHNAVIVDICSGSGAIALALASQLPDALCLGLESDPMCISYSRASSSDAALEQRVKFVYGNVLSSWNLFLGEVMGRVDLIVSNPPYVREERLDSARMASPREPAQALYGGRSGLLFYKRIVAQSADWLRPGGTLLLEIDDGLEDGILDLFERYKMEKGRWLPDLRGMPRYAEARRGI